jgi:hypothetical protein
VKLSSLQAMVSVLLAAVICVPAWASNTDTTSTMPGTLNYVEGHVQFNDTSLDSKSVGESMLGVDQTLNTKRGKAELVLTPGVFLRAGDNTSVKMVADSLTNTELELLKGEAMVEVTDLYKENDIRIREGNATARLLKPGLYDFDLNQNEIRVFNGKASVTEGDRHVMLKSGRDTALTGDSFTKPRKFDKEAFENDLYRWSNLRSTYIAEANEGSGQWTMAYGWYGPGWWGPGWWGPGWGWGWGGWGWDGWGWDGWWGPGWGGWWGPWW